MASKTREELESEARAMSASQVAEAQKTAERQCRDWRATVAAEEEEDSALFGLWSGEADPASIEARDGWCLREEVLRADIQRRKTEGPPEERAQVQEEQERVGKEWSERVEAQSEEARREAAEEDCGLVCQAQNWIGVGSGQSLSERAEGGLRLALIAGAAVLAYLVLRNVVGGAVGVAERSATRVFEGGKDVIGRVV